MIVDGNISDLFFNTNMDHATIYENGRFLGYKENVIAKEATTFIETLSRLGVATPAPADLVADFYARI